jgi:hypothetical protein
VLQIGESDAGHQRVPVQAGPGPALEVAKTEFLLQLLVHLLDSPIAKLITLFPQPICQNEERSLAQA